MDALYSESVVAKVWNIASKAVSSVRNPARNVELEELQVEKYGSALTPKAEQTTHPLP